MQTIGFIGTGNIGGSLIRGILNNKLTDAGNIVVYDIDSEKLESFTSETGTRAAIDNSELTTLSDIIILAVKPDAAPAVLDTIKEQLTADKLLISVVLGLSIERMSAASGGRARYIRCMPNVPALVNAGMTCVAMGGTTTGEDKKIAADLFNAIGLTEFLSEKDLEKVTALTGSSPAYIFVLIESMADAAVLSGLPRALSYRLAAQAVLGSAKMALEAGKHPGELKDMVCSPAGSTIEAIRVLEQKGFRTAIIEAMRACDQRAREIASK